MVGEYRPRERVLVVAGSPEPSSPELLRRLVSDVDRVVAVDRGLDACIAADVTPNDFVGDADSASPVSLSRLDEMGCAVCTFTTQKDYTDLGLALRILRDPSGELDATNRAEKRALAKGSRLPQVILTCSSGGRPDHFLGVFGAMCEYADLEPMLVEDGFECHVLAPEGRRVWRAGAGDVGHTVSVVAIAADTLASERGLRWELDHVAMPVLSDLGVSNVVEHEGDEVECHSGAVAVFLRD